VASIVADSIIVNDGTLDDLAKVARKVREDLLDDSLQETYAASQITR
jgi:hypothetical protein